MSDEKRDAEGFKVTDRRSFTSQGELREDKPAEAAPKEKPAPDPRVSASTGPGTRGPERPRPAEPPPGRSKGAPVMDFSSFLLSLATTAMVHLGEIGDPAGGKGRVNLDAAKQMVEILTMLQEKTEGNRSPEENRLLDDILYEIRMKILAKTKAIQL